LSKAGEGEGARRAVILTLAAAALGYFVDIYDLVLFSIVRVKSLESLGVPHAELLDRGVLLLNVQMGGMLVGGVLWGTLGDRRGRMSVLFGSIFLYSMANLLNGFVQGMNGYLALRLLAGIGLAGELGAGITLLSEIMGREARGYGAALVAMIGVLGGAFAAVVGEAFAWRTAYFIGGGLGLALLLLRIGVRESGMFESAKKQGVRRGDVLMLFSCPRRAKRFFTLVLLGVPIWYVSGILLTFAPEIGSALGMSAPPDAGRAILCSYLGVAFGDLASGTLSQIWKSRRRAVFAFLALTVLTTAAYFLLGPRSRAVFYGVCVALGVSTGYWALFVTMASEQFGTNLRATATTCAPNFVRGSVVPLTLTFQLLRGSLGVALAAITVGVVALVFAAIAASGLEETYGRDLDFVER
jgi:predicted MFS family arabinose efflux permease